MSVNYKEAPQQNTKFFQTELDDGVNAEKADSEPTRKSGISGKDRRPKDFDQSIPQSIKEFLKSDPISQQKMMDNLNGSGKNS